MGFLSLTIAFSAGYACFVAFSRRLYALANVVGAFLVFAASLTGLAWILANFLHPPFQYAHGLDLVAGSAPLAYLGYAAAWYGWCLGIRWIYRRRCPTAPR